MSGGDIYVYMVPSVYISYKGSLLSFSYWRLKIMTTYQIEIVVFHPHYLNTISFQIGEKTKVCLFRQWLSSDNHIG